MSSWGALALSRLFVDVFISLFRPSAVARCFVFRGLMVCSKCRLSGRFSMLTSEPGSVLRPEIVEVRVQ